MKMGDEVDLEKKSEERRGGGELSQDVKEF